METGTNCQCTPVVGTRFDGEHGRKPSIAIIEAVAAAENVTPAELEPVFEEVDPESIDSLLTDRSDGPIRLQFYLCGWNVYVRSSGAIRVCDPDLQTAPGSVFEKPIAD